uniref:ZP domain-containing protein n=1 Tax=Mesocestoides corti TaxID=53468 RepID=A0A5K3EQY8_MESCO
MAVAVLKVGCVLRASGLVVRRRGVDVTPDRSAPYTCFPRSIVSLLMETSSSKHRQRTCEAPRHSPPALATCGQTEVPSLVWLGQPRPSVRSTAQATWCQVDPQASDDLVIASDAVLWVPMRENGVGTSRRDEKFPPAVGVQIRFQTRQDENTRPRDTLTIKGNPSQLNFCTVARVTYNCYHYHCEPRNQSKCDLPPDQPPRLPPPQIPCCLTSSARGCRVVPIKTAVVAPCIGDLAD